MIMCHLLALIQMDYSVDDEVIQHQLEVRGKEIMWIKVIFFVFATMEYVTACFKT